MKVNEKLREYLDKEGLRYKVFARKHLELSPSYFSALLMGNYKIPQKYWKKIIEVTQGFIKLEDFLDD